LIDEDRALVSSTATGGGVINPLQITALNQKIDSLQTQLTTQQGKINTLLELMTGVPVAEESSELRAQIRQVDLPPSFDNK